MFDLWFLVLPDVRMPQSKDRESSHVTNISFFIWGRMSHHYAGTPLESPGIFSARTSSVSVIDAEF